MFSDLQVKVAVESGIQAAKFTNAKVGLLTKSWSELNSYPGASITLPIYDLSAAGEFAAGTNDYSTGSNEVNGVEIPCNIHLVKSVSITDRQLAETGIAWVKDTTTALVNNIGRAINKTVFGLINSTNCELTATLTSTKAGFADLYAVAADNDIPVEQSIVVLTPEHFAKCIGTLDANVYGGSEAIRQGICPGLFGFKAVVASTNLGTSSDKGAIVLDTAIGTVNRYLAPAEPAAYPFATSVGGDGDSMVYGLRRFMDLGQGVEKYACDVLFGAKIIQANKIVRLV